MAADRLDSSSKIQDHINRLRSPVPDLTTLLGLLSAPLDCLSLLPPRFHRYNTSPLPHDAFQISRHVPLLQRALLEHIVPTWRSSLEEENMLTIVDQYFVPDVFLSATSAAGQVSMHAYSTILSLPLGDYSLSILCRLASFYPIDRMHTSVFEDKAAAPVRQATRLWEDTVRNVLSAPAKVANALHGKGIPPALEQGPYFRALAVRIEALLAALAERRAAGGEPSRRCLTWRE
jgi:telomere length regulation protein